MNTNKELMIEIKAALAAVPELADCLADIYVLVNDGAVIVSGHVESPKHRELIKKTVSAITGVDQLITEIKIQQNVKHRVGVEIDWANGHMALR